MAEYNRARQSTELPQPRRAVTLPLRVLEPQIERRNSDAQLQPQVETLFEHPSARIVAFSTSPSSSAQSSPIRGIAEAEDEIGTLPWSSRLERTIAVGPLRVYRAPGSVVFLNCRSIVKPIFPKSRCWCVDDASSKFVLQMKHPQYWRIEVPADSDADVQQGRQLAEVLSRFLLFEKTACPFKRSFTVPLPAESPISIKKRPWRPVSQPHSTAESVIKPAEEIADNEIGESYYSAVSDDEHPYEAFADSDGTDDTNITPKNPLSRSRLSKPHLEECGRELSRPEVLHARRAVTAPPQLTLVTSPPSKGTGRNVSPDACENATNEAKTSDLSSSVESFHSVLSWHSPITPLPPSPPQSDPPSPTSYSYPHDHISLPKRGQHTREISELTITTQTPRTWDLTPDTERKSIMQELASPPPPKTPTLVDDIEENLDEEHFEIATPPAQLIRHRATTSSNSRRRALSPLPPAANIFSPPRRRPRHLQTERHLPTAIIQKTCEILLSPPSHLINLMLDIAAKIAAGEWKGMVFGFGESGEKFVGQWDYDYGAPIDEWDEDDYGISLSGNHERRRATTGHMAGGSWEID